MTLLNSSTKTKNQSQKYNINTSPASSRYFLKSFMIILYMMKYNE
ncbi:hypothetical protein VRK_09570 [Vibrio sp. MEBiC08052]|nr:hypothetical protein VRK_09570 [Vibrio sp. MEBiC08052]